MQTSKVCQVVVVVVVRRKHHLLHVFYIFVYRPGGLFVVYMYTQYYTHIHIYIYIYMSIVGVDIGIRHLGLVGARRWVHASVRCFHIEWTLLVDLTSLPHTQVSIKQCTIPHTRDLAARLRHFQQEYGHLLDIADIVAVERQPLQGLQAVQLFFQLAWPTTVVLVSPNAMHTWLGIGMYEYEGRKEHTVAAARRMLELCGYAPKDVEGMLLGGGDRKHDVADAACVALFYSQKILADEEDRKIEKHVAHVHEREVVLETGEEKNAVELGKVLRRLFTFKKPKQT